MVVSVAIVLASSSSASAGAQNVGVPLALSADLRALASDRPSALHALRYVCLGYVSAMLKAGLRLTPHHLVAALDGALVLTAFVSALLAHGTGTVAGPLSAQRTQFGHSIPLVDYSLDYRVVYA